MRLPFTVEQFHEVFRAYNETLWPAQVFLVGCAVVAIGLVLAPRRGSGVALSAILAFLWAWVALAYHLAFFSRINPLAYAFAALSLAGALAFLWQGVVLRRLRFAWAGGGRAIAGTGLILFALVVYPAWSMQAGHPYPAMPTFGLPCPTTLFTIGLLAFLVPPYPRSVFVVPILWCFVGGQAAFLLGVYPDLGLLAAGGIGVVLAWRSGTPLAGAQRME